MIAYNKYKIINIKYKIRRRIKKALSPFFLLLLPMIDITNKLVVKYIYLYLFPRINNNKLKNLFICSVDFTYNT